MKIIAKYSDIEKKIIRTFSKGKTYNYRRKVKGMKYSNCLIEALKAKIKDPKNVKIVYLGKKINNGARHCLWINYKTNTVTHYTHSEDEKFYGLFKGYYKQSSIEDFEAFLLNRAYFKGISVQKLAKKYKLPSFNKPGFLDWYLYIPEFNQYNLPKQNQLAKYILYFDGSEKNIKMLKIKDLDLQELSKKEAFNWKYVSPYCQEYTFHIE